MKEAFQVSQATREDLKELSELFNKYRMFYGQQSDVPQAYQFLFERFEHRESIILVVKDMDKQVIAGFTQLYPVFSSISMRRSLILNDLYVLESYRKQGLGQQLLDGAKRYAQQVHAKGLGLATAVTNEPAQRLYERNGYKRDEEFYHYFLPC